VTYVYPHPKFFLKEDNPFAPTDEQRRMDGRMEEEESEDDGRNPFAPTDEQRRMDGRTEGNEDDTKDEQKEKDLKAVSVFFKSLCDQERWEDSSELTDQYYAGEEGVELGAVELHKDEEGASQFSAPVKIALVGCIFSLHHISIFISSLCCKPQGRTRIAVNSILR